MSHNNVKVFIENARAIARSVKIGENIYELAQQRNISIVPADLPDLFKLKANPAEVFVRHITLAIYELERNLIVDRLTHGFQQAKGQSQRLTQTGKTKCNGALTTLERKPPTKSQLKALQEVRKQQVCGNLSWRGVRDRFRKVLRKSSLGIHTVRRLCLELQLNYGGSRKLKTAK